MPNYLDRHFFYESFCKGVLEEVDICVGRVSEWSSWWGWTSTDLSKVPIENVKGGTRVNALLYISLFVYLFFELLSSISGVIVPPLPPSILRPWN